MSETLESIPPKSSAPTPWMSQMLFDSISWNGYPEGYEEEFRKDNESKN